MDSKTLGMALLVLAAVLAIVGAGLLSGLLDWFGRLPGDIRHEGESLRVYVPLTSMLLLSLLLSLIFLLAGRLR